jgi:membrane peptidoglycan carboxypeptidase
MSQRKTSAAHALGAVLGGVGLSVLAGILIAALVTPTLVVVGSTVKESVGIFDSLPTFIEIDQQAQRNRIFATQDGQPVEIATVFSQNREEVAWDEVSDFAKDAAVSGEDRRYFEHGGIDPKGIVRAAAKNLKSGSAKEGASTITQQYVKNTFVQAALELPTEAEQKAAYDAATNSDFDRKLKEMKLAISLEKRYSKQEILLAYLNIANFGGNTYGIQAAASRYFNVSAIDLTAAQAASLVAIVQFPAALSLDDPANYAANTERRDVILDWMFSDGKLTNEQHAEAIATVIDGSTVSLTEPSNGCGVANEHARYFCDYITKLVKDLPALGADPEERERRWKHGGYDVYTTLDLGIQTTAQDAVWANVPDNATALNLGSSAVTVEVSTGRILAMAQNKKYDSAGGIDTAHTAVNFSTDLAYGGSSGFQPGSTYKIFTLLNWLENGHGVNEVVDGSARTVSQGSFTDSCGGPWGGPYPFKNDDGTSGQMTVARATQKSVNGAFISMAQKLDLCEIRDTASSIGVHRADGKELETNPSSVLGTNTVAPLTMATAYAAIAAGGNYCKSIAIDRIVGPDGAELGGQSADCTKALDSDVANTAAFAMAKVMLPDGTASRANPRDGVEYIGKTGTSDGSNQTWVVGASTKVATAVWVGNISGYVPIRSYTSPKRVAGGFIRHDVFKAIALAVDARPELRGSDFPDPAKSLLVGSGVTVPEISGQSMEAATALLEAKGFTVRNGGPASSTAKEGRAASTSPATGTVASQGTTITLYSSDGTLGLVPNEVGNGDVPSAAAVNDLQLKGFTNVTADGCEVLPADRIANEGNVVAQAPAAGSSVNLSDPITLTIGRASC